MNLHASNGAGAQQQTVFINGRFLEQRVTGVQRFAIETLLALDELLDTERGARLGPITVLAPRGARTLPLRRIRIRQVGPLHGHAWEQLILPMVTGRSVLLSFGPTGPVAKRNQIVTIHDAAIRALPDGYSRRFRAWYELVVPLLSRRCRFVMTVSQFSRAELATWFGLEPARVGVSGEGWQHMLRVPPDPRIFDKYQLEPRGYLLAVSSVTKAKNFGVIARALARLPENSGVRVAVAGGASRSVFAGGPSVSKALQWLGYVSDAELRALYTHAAAFIFPSLYEGFGLPPLEAMALGCPVISSNAASLPEVCGDAALYFDPNDASALADCMLRLTSNAAERDDLIRKGRDRLRSYSWSGAASAYLPLLRAERSA